MQKTKLGFAAAQITICTRLLHHSRGPCPIAVEGANRVATGAQHSRKCLFAPKLQLYDSVFGTGVLSYEHRRDLSTEFFHCSGNGRREELAAARGLFRFRAMAIAAERALAVVPVSFRLVLPVLH